MKRLPRTVQVCDQTYAVEKGDPDEMGADEGWCEPVEGKITVRKDILPNALRTRGVLAHELAHATIDATGANRHLAPGDDSEELFVCAFVPAFLMALESAGLLKKV